MMFPYDSQLLQLIVPRNCLDLSFAERCRTLVYSSQQRSTHALFTVLRENKHIVYLTSIMFNNIDADTFI